MAAEGGPAAVEPKSIRQLADGLRSRSHTSLQLTEALLERIEKWDPVINAFVAVSADRAREDASRADEELRSGQDRGLLHGIPYALKDIFDVRGMPTSCCSRICTDRRPEEDSFVQSRLFSAGAVLLGKTTTHELALGGPSFDLPFPPARNPYDPDFFSGGSSSGSAAAVAAGFAPLTIGSDTSGSIRGPAFYCGVVGLKPTYGLVSRRGAFPLSYSLDHCGPLAWTVDDAAIALNVLAEYDPRDPSSVSNAEEDYSADIALGAEGLRLGYARDFFAAECERDVLAHIDEAAQSLALAGAVVDEVSLPSFDLFRAAGRLIMTAEAYSIHADALGRDPHAFGRYTYQRLIPGSALSAYDYIQAQRLRGELTRLLNHGPLRQYDALICGVAMATAPRLDSFGQDWDPQTSMRSIAFTVTGNPAIAVPLGVGERGLPTGLQLVGRLFGERTLLRAAAAVERVRREHRQPPRLRPSWSEARQSATPQGNAVA